MSFANIGKQIIENKNRYKDDEESKNKLTYNFVTDPRLRRGHNYGVIYVTSSNYDENNENIRSIPQKPKLKSLNNYKISQSVNTNTKKFNMRIECKEKSFNDFGIFTEKVNDITHPKPISFEVGIQRKNYRNDQFRLVRGLKKKASTLKLKLTMVIYSISMLKLRL